MNQMEPLYQIASLIEKSFKGELTIAEEAQLEDWKNANSNNRKLFETLSSEDYVKEELLHIESFNSAEGWKALNKKQLGSNKPTHYKRSIKMAWLSAAAACLLFAIAFAWLQYDGKVKSNTSKNNFNNKYNILPGSNKAVLTLADGSEIILNDSANRLLKQQSGLEVLIKAGEIKYKSTASETVVLYNKVSTPKGGQYKLVLADGTIAWLNAASSLRYPTSFIGKERVVELTGEGYFEVAHNPSKPFKVTLPGIGLVEAIGTVFNINAYKEEVIVKTTLLNGKVKVYSNNLSAFLLPGQQAQFLTSGEINLNEHVNLNEVVAWKNGQFVFNSLTIEQIMRQISRWYDIDVSYNGKIGKETFSGIVSRNSNLPEVLNIMEESGVKFKIEDKRILVY